MYSLSDILLFVSLGEVGQETFPSRRKVSKTAKVQLFITFCHSHSISIGHDIYSKWVASLSRGLILAPWRVVVVECGGMTWCALRMALSAGRRGGRLSLATGLTGSMSKARDEINPMGFLLGRWFSNRKLACDGDDNEMVRLSCSSIIRVVKCRIGGYECSSIKLPYLHTWNALYTHLLHYMHTTCWTNSKSSQVHETNTHQRLPLGISKRK